MLLSTLVMVTVLLSVICDNHVRDNGFIISLFMKTTSSKPCSKTEMQNLNCTNLRSTNVYGNSYKDVFLPLLEGLHKPIYKHNVLHGTEDRYGIDRRLNNDFTENNHNNKQKPIAASPVPIAHYKEFYNDLILEDKKREFKRTDRTRNNNRVIMSLRGKCDCKIKNDLMDLGPLHYPRFLLNSVCQAAIVTDNLAVKCAYGLVCRPLEYKVNVLVYHTVNDDTQKAATLSWLPQELRQVWKFKSVTVTAGCFCA
uniref:Prothoracicotropic hormone n=1 Tax=Glossina pallidipes TaxID=7398 RepID=A0A1A9Z8N1_GLOPL